MNIDITTSWAQWGIKGDRKAVTRYHAKGDYLTVDGRRKFDLCFMTENNGPWLCESQPRSKKPKTPTNESEKWLIQEIIKSLPSPANCPAPYFKQEMLEMIRGGESLASFKVLLGEFTNGDLIEGGKYVGRDGMYMLNNRNGKIRIESLPPGSIKPSLVSMNVEVSDFIEEFDNNGFEILMSALEAALRTIYL